MGCACAGVGCAVNFDPKAPRLRGEALEDALSRIHDSDLVEAVRYRDLEHEFEEECSECTRRQFEEHAPLITHEEATEVYYAMCRGDMDRVRQFVLGAAGRIA